MGILVATFQFTGRLPSLKDFLNIMDRGKLASVKGIPSSTVALPG